MMKALLLLAACLAPCSVALAAGESGGSTLPIVIAAPKEWKVSMEFARTKVAAGAIKNESHQSEFTVRVLDGKGKPVVGTEVQLPKILAGGLGPKKEIAASLEWKAKFVNGKQITVAKTDKKGEAKGIYTSGNRTELVQFETLGGAHAFIEQIWNEKLDASEDTFLENGKPIRVEYPMAFMDGGKKYPIVGHKAHWEPLEAHFSVTDPTLGPDEDKDGKPDGEWKTVIASKEKPDDPFWKAFLQWSKWDYPMFEETPGNYVGQYLINVPEGAVIAGLNIDDVNHVRYQFVEESCFGKNGLE